MDSSIISKTEGSTVMGKRDKDENGSVPLS